MSDDILGTSGVPCLTTPHQVWAPTLTGAEGKSLSEDAITSSMGSNRYRAEGKSCLKLLPSSRTRGFVCVCKWLSVDTASSSHTWPSLTGRAGWCSLMTEYTDCSIKRAEVSSVLNCDSATITYDLMTYVSP